MKSVKTLIIVGLLLILSSFSCNNNQTRKEKPKTDQEETDVVPKAGPPVIIYKTKVDYTKNVPVVLNEEKTAVVSYPDKRDVKKGGEFSYPGELNDGYLLDNRGIDKNAAFISLTYEEYYNLDKTPDSEQLFGMIIDKDPFTEIYHCGSRFDFKDLVPELNEIISSGDLSKFTKLK